MPDEPTEPTQGEPQTIEPVTQEPEIRENQKPDYEKSYKELQSKFNARDEEIKTARQTAKDKEELEKQIDNWKALGQVIESDPTLFKLVETKLNSPTEQNSVEAPDEVKQTISQNVVKEFETKYGIDKLDADKAQAIRTRIGQEIQQVSGQSINDVPLSKLGLILEKGYQLATANDKEEQARRQGYLEARENREAEFGSIQSTGVNSQIKPLTPDEQSVARKLHMSDEDYAKYKDK